jgi:RNA recognition motif-containing protein
MKIFVSNLTTLITEEGLQQLFEPYGIVKFARIVLSRQTGRSLGYGCIEMPNVTEAQTAVEKLHRTTIEGHTLGLKVLAPLTP